MKQKQTNQPTSEIFNSGKRNLFDSNREQFASRESFKPEYLYFSMAAKTVVLNIWSFRRARKFQTVETVTFAERESFRNEYLYASQNAKAAVMHNYTLRKTRKLQPVKTATFAERESFRNEYLYASLSAKASKLNIYTICRARRLQNPCYGPFLKCT